jgi:hypothetical protein
MTAFCLLLIPVARNRIPSVSAFAIAGCLAGGSFLIRDVYHFVMPILALGAGIVLLARGTPLRAAILSGVALTIPVFIIAVGLQEWNAYRTGHRVTTTAGQTAYIYAVLRAAEHNPAVISGPTHIEAVLRETNRTFDYVDTRRANDILFHRDGMNAVAQLEHAQSLFWRTLRQYPDAYAQAALKRVRFVQQASLFWSPLTRLDDLHWWAGGATEEGYRTGWRADALAFLQTRDWRKLTPEIFLNLGLRKGSQYLGIAFFLIFLVGTPLAWGLLRSQLGGPINAAFAAWIVYGLWVCLYLLVSFEVRYLSPVIGPALFATALVVVNSRTLIALLHGTRLVARITSKP